MNAWEIFRHLVEIEHHLEDSIARGQALGSNKLEVNL